MLKLKQVHLSFEDGDELFSVTTCRSVSSEGFSLDIHTTGDFFSADIRSGRPVTLRQLSAVFEHDFSDQDRIFLNGYQSWTDSVEHRTNGRMHSLERVPAKTIEKWALNRYGDYDFTSYGPEGQLHGWSYGYVRTREFFCFIGSLSEKSGFTKIATDTAGNIITVTKDCSGLELCGDYSGIDLIITEGSEKEVFDRWAEALGTKLRPDVKPVFGYTSWYRHYQNISDSIIAQDLEGLAGQKFKADIFQIDDGYQTAVGDWLSVDSEKFPEGMKKTAGDIRSKDMVPGLWLAPLVCEEKSELFAQHKDWLVTDDEGNYVKGGSNWSGFYALDIYNQDFRKHLRNVFNTVVNDWGFGLLKLDFLYAACIVPRPDKTRGMIMADAMAMLREFAGDALILGCGVPLASAFGYVDYCRIGCDVSLDWNDKPHMRLLHRERVSTRNTILNSVFRRQLNGRFFYNDPDVFILRSDNTSLTAPQKKCLAEINAMTGGVLFNSDNAAEYTSEQLRLLSGIMKLRDAEIISAETTEKLLKIRFMLGEKVYNAQYRI